MSPYLYERLIQNYETQLFLKVLILKSNLILRFELAAQMSFLSPALVCQKGIKNNDPKFSFICQCLHSIHRNLPIGLHLAYFFLSQTISHTLVQVHILCFFLNLLFLLPCSFTQVSRAADSSPSESMHWCTQHSIFFLLYSQLSETP